uniref:Protein CHUP1, chloroplastic n=1 Tax=Leersia perrieri TaxID=77586 RepID=A0A0D9XVU5_9ORYZ
MATASSPAAFVQQDYHHDEDDEFQDDDDLDDEFDGDDDQQEPSDGADEARLQSVLRRLTADEVPIRVHDVQIRGCCRTRRAAVEAAVKADVETQGEFVESLANEVRAAKFVNIDDVVAFVNWLDEELSFLVDERAVLKHFDWPESKTDALREAAFEYQDLLKLEYKVSSFTDDSKLPCEEALKKMYSLLEKVEQSVYAVLRTRDMAISRYREYGIPVDWLSDSGVVGKIKLASVQLAKKYMKRVATELDALQGNDKEPNREFLLLQGVRFAFRVHQFAGGFDEESMKAFEELRSKMSTQTSAPQISDA